MNVYTLQVENRVKLGLIRFSTADADYYQMKQAMDEEEEADTAVASSSSSSSSGDAAAATASTTQRVSFGSK